MGNTDSAELELLGELADEFLIRWKSGKRLSIDGLRAASRGGQGDPGVVPNSTLLEKISRIGRLDAIKRRERIESRTVLPATGEQELYASWGVEGWGSSSKGSRGAGIGVAVKILPGSAIYDAHTRRRFLREARIIARLRHPQIVPIPPSASRTMCSSTSWT